jgi:prophage regulatory protein
MSYPLSLRRCQEARAVFGISTATFYEWITKGVMTPGVAIGARSVAWPAHELEILAAARIAGKTEAEINTLVQDLVKSRATLADKVAA